MLYCSGRGLDSLVLRSDSGRMYEFDVVFCLIRTQGNMTYSGRSLSASIVTKNSVNGNIIVQ